MSEEKTSEFLEKYTKEHPETGAKYIDAIGALTEMYARIKGIQGTQSENETLLGDALGAITDLNERVRKLEGKSVIEVVSESEANSIIRRG